MPHANRAHSARWLLPVVAIVALVVAATVLPLGAWLSTFVAWVQSMGALGVVIFAAVYIAATVALVPGSILTLGAGLVYGPLWGTLLVSPVSVIGATLAFLLSRHAFRTPFEQRVAASPKLQAITDSVNDQGAQLVFLLRLSPAVPFALLNYVLGLTRVGVWRYVLASFVGMLPGTFLYVYLGSLGQQLGASDPNGGDAAGPWDDVLLWSGLAATVLVTVLVTRAARAKLKERDAQLADS